MTMMQLQDYINQIQHENRQMMQRLSLVEESATQIIENAGQLQLDEDKMDRQLVSEIISLAQDCLKKCLREERGDTEEEMGIRTKISDIIMSHSIYESPEKRQESIHPYQDVNDQPKQQEKRHQRRSINKSITSDGGGVSSVRNLKRVNYKIDSTKNDNIRVISSSVEKEETNSDQSCNISHSQDEETKEETSSFINPDFLHETQTRKKLSIDFSRRQSLSRYLRRSSIPPISHLQQSSIHQRQSSFDHESIVTSLTSEFHSQYRKLIDKNASLQSHINDLYNAISYKDQLLEQKFNEIESFKTHISVVNQQNTSQLTQLSQLTAASETQSQKLIELQGQNERLTLQLLETQGKLTKQREHYLKVVKCQNGQVDAKSQVIDAYHDLMRLEKQVVEFSVMQQKLLHEKREANEQFEVCLGELHRTQQENRETRVINENLESQMIDYQDIRQRLFQQIQSQ